jgi:putative transposase
MYCGCNRFVWNNVLAIQKERYANGEKHLSYVDTAAFLPAWKMAADTSFLKAAPSQSLQQTLKHLDRAYQDAFRKDSGKQFPRFKKRGCSGDSFILPQGFKMDEQNARIYLPKIGWMRYRKSRMLGGVAKNVTISRKNNKWYISVQCEAEVHKPVHPEDSAVGIDRGIVILAACSDGRIYESICALKTLEKKLMKLQRS